MNPAQRRPQHLTRLALVASAIALAGCGSGSHAGGSTTPTTQVGATTTSSTTGSGAASTATTAAVGGTAASWLTFGNGPTRTGIAVTSGSFGSLHATWHSATLDGQVYAEPLIDHGLVIVVTENDTAYGLSATTGATVWSTHLATPAPGSALPCGNISPLGATSTPAIDPSTGRLFVVAETYANETVGHRFFALDARTGRELWSESADPSGMATPTDQQQRSSLVIAHGRVYFGFGGLYGDCGSYHGWVVSLPTGGVGAAEGFEVAAANQAAVWAPSGPAVDAKGNIWVATGNGSSRTSYDEGNSVLELSPALSLEQSFAPTAWAADNAGDLDLGSTSPQLLTGGLVLIVGKESTAYLLRASHLGGIGGQVYAANLCFVIGADADQGADVFVPCKSGLEEVRVTAGASPSFGVGWTAAGVNGPPIVAGGLVWSIDQTASSLVALDAATGAIVERFTLSGTPDNYATPAAAGRLLVAAGGSTVDAFAP